jgi:predicted adenine nucleotide alpha hydrolase (AANH) superfamily ATPase
LKKKLLLHICCAPCAVYVFEKLNREYHVTGFFYNPNIHPREEYGFRKTEIDKISRQHQWKIITGEYDMEEWFHCIRGHEKQPERGSRCSICFRMRLKKTFKQAREAGHEIVATTLSISPYKVTQQINNEGLRLSREFGIEFLAENFKKQDGFTICRKMAHDQGIKHQDYCGCVYSRVEKILKIRKTRITY